MGRASLLKMPKKKKAHKLKPIPSPCKRCLVTETTKRYCDECSKQITEDIKKGV